MRSAISGRSMMRHGPGALLAFLVVFVVDPGSAQAGCSSHYVPTISLARGTGPGLETRGPSSGRVLAVLEEIPAEPKPCRGEMCSGRPALPLSSAPPQVLLDGSWAILDEGLAVPTPGRSQPRPDDPDVSPNHPGCSIFHPPRLSHSLLTD